MSVKKYLQNIFILTLLLTFLVPMVFADGNIYMQNAYDNSYFSDFQVNFTSATGTQFGLSTNNGSITYPYYGWTNGISTKGLVADYRFNQTSGQLIDYSGNGNNGNLSGYTFNNGNITNVTFNSSGANFNGVNSIIRTGIYSAQINFSNPFTLTVYFKFTGVSDNKGIIGRWTASSEERETGILINTNSQIQYKIRNASESDRVITSSISYNDSIFHQITGVYNGTHMSLFIDGINVSSPISVSIINGSSSSDFRVGYFAGATNSHFNGSIQSVQIFNRSLNATEVSQLYNCTNGTNKYSCIGDGLVFQNVYTDNRTYNDTTVQDVNHLVQGYNLSRSNYSMRFDGISSHILLNNSPSMNYTDTSVCLWYNPYNLISNSTPLYNSFTSGYQFSISTNGLYLQIRNETGNYKSIVNTSSSVRTKNVWHFACGVMSLNGTYSLYSNNGNPITSTYNGLFYGAGERAGIGNSYTPNLNNFNGSIDDVLIYNRSLDATEVKFLYNTYASKYNLTALQDTYYLTNVNDVTFSAPSDVFVIRSGYNPSINTNPIANTPAGYQQCQLNSFSVNINQILTALAFTGSLIVVAIVFVIFGNMFLFAKSKREEEDTKDIQHNMIEVFKIMGMVLLLIGSVFLLLFIIVFVMGVLSNMFCPMM